MGGRTFECLDAVINRYAIQLFQYKKITFVVQKHLKDAIGTKLFRIIKINNRRTGTAHHYIIYHNCLRYHIT